MVWRTKKLRADVFACVVGVVLESVGPAVLDDVTRDRALWELQGRN